MGTSNKTQTSVLALAVSLATGALLYAAPAVAVNKWTSFHQASNGNCQASDDSDNIYMARTPTGYLNTRANNSRRGHDIEVTCSPMGNSYALSKGGIGRTVAQVVFYGRNTRNNIDVTLACVLTVGYVDSPLRVELPLSVTLTKSGAPVGIRWNEPAFASYYPTPLEISCDVPAGVELTDSYVYQEVDVGN